MEILLILISSSILPLPPPCHFCPPSSPSSPVPLLPQGRGGSRTAEGGGGAGADHLSPVVRGGDDPRPDPEDQVHSGQPPARHQPQSQDVVAGRGGGAGTQVFRQDRHPLRRRRRGRRGRLCCRRSRRLRIGLEVKEIEDGVGGESQEVEGKSGTQSDADVLEEGGAS